MNDGLHTETRQLIQVHVCMNIHVMKTVQSPDHQKTLIENQQTQ